MRKLQSVTLTTVLLTTLSISLHISASVSAEASADHNPFRSGHGASEKLLTHHGALRSIGLNEKTFDDIGNQSTQANTLLPELKKQPEFTALFYKKKQTTHRNNKPKQPHHQTHSPHTISTTNTSTS